MYTQIGKTGKTIQKDFLVLNERIQKFKPYMMKVMKKELPYPTPLKTFLKIPNYKIFDNTDGFTNHIID